MSGIHSGEIVDNIIRRVRRTNDDCICSRRGHFGFSKTSDTRHRDYRSVLDRAGMKLVPL
jgi:hypothetical protein